MWSGTLSGSDSCQSQSIMVVYQDPSQMTTNSAVVVADGSSAWHIEENGQIAYGATPPNAGLNWACANLNCSTNETLSMSAIGGNHDCGVADDWDQIISGGATIFAGPHDILDCGTGLRPNRRNCEIIRVFYPFPQARRVSPGGLESAAAGPKPPTGRRHWRLKFPASL